MYRNSITSLLITDRVFTRRDEENYLKYYTYHCGTIVNRLDQFPRLKNLEIIKHCYQDIESCQTLTSLYYRIYQPFNSSENFPKKSTCPSPIVPRPLIKHVKMNAKVDSDQTLQYIMEKYPKLESLYDDSADPLKRTFNLEFSRCKARCSKSILVKFFKYLSSIPKYLLALVYAKPDTIVDELVYYARISPGLQFNLYLRHIEYTNYTLPGNKVDIRMENGTDTNKPFAVIPYSSERGINMANYVNAIEKCGHLLFGELTIDVHHDLLFDIEAHYEMNTETAYCFDHVFKCCPNLQTLKIYHADLNHCDPVSKSINKSIKALYLVESNLSQHILPELSTRLPSLDSLYFDTCQFDETRSDNDMGYDILIKMKHTSFDKIYVALKETFNKRYATMYLKQNNGSEQYYKFDVPRRTNPNIVPANASVKTNLNEHRNDMANNLFYSVYIECHSVYDIRLCL